MIWLAFPGNMVIWSGTFARIPDSVVESAKLDGVNWVQELFLVILPMVWSTFGLMLTLTLCGLFSASGAVFLLIVDNVSRNVTSAGIPIGILTAFVGAPFFLWLITGRRHEE